MACGGRQSIAIYLLSHAPLQTASLDRLVRAQQNRGGYGKAKRSGGLEVDDHLGRATSRANRQRVRRSTLRWATGIVGCGIAQTTVTRHRGEPWRSTAFSIPISR